MNHTRPRSRSDWTICKDCLQKQQKIDRLEEELRRVKAKLRYQDRTAKEGYAWLFCAPMLSLLRFRSSRSGKVAHEVLGNKRLPGTLVVDRYHGYNEAPCHLQYRYSHLSRDIEDLQKDSPDNPEVNRFVEPALPQLAAAMSLRHLRLSKSQFQHQATTLRRTIEQTMNASASHPGIQHIQDVFREKGGRMYRWALDPRIPAENNRAERELRPLVIVRKISFGSQSKGVADPAKKNPRPRRSAHRRVGCSGSRARC